MNRSRIRWFLILLALVGCTRSTADFQASIYPTCGYVPFEATITAFDIGDSYAFHLPGETITQDSPFLEVTVDSLDWRATVETMCGGQIYVDDVRAIGNNPPPSVYSMVINGNRDRWELCPLERTLLEFELSPGAEIVDVDVWGDAFPERYSIFCPPYDGTFHAFYMGHTWEDACIVYPVYCSIPGEVLPYSPTGLDEGYPYLGWRATNLIAYRLEKGVEIPAQQGYVTVVVRDWLGQQTSVTFMPRIRAQNFL